MLNQLKLLLTIFTIDVRIILYLVLNRIIAIVWMEGISVSFSIDRVLDVMELFIMNKSFEGNAIIFSLLSSLLISSTKEYNFIRIDLDYYKEKLIQSEV